MPLVAVVDLLTVLRKYAVLEPGQLVELTSPPEATFPNAKALAKELLRRGWLTPYQANQLLVGKGAELVLGSYILLERLGEGGMGAVFKARHLSLDRVVALKVIRKDRVASEAAVRRFQREVRAAAQLEHPNVVRAFDADQAGGSHFLVMEHVEGTDLAKFVRQQGPLPVVEACECVRQAALGLQHAHERGLVHRDVKPANLLRTAAGGEVKVLDLGLARLHQPGEADGEASSTLTQDGAVMGTLDYLAPEQAEDAHQADIRSDLYSLGCTFYHLLTGQVPHPGGTTTQKILKHRFDEPLPVEQLRPDVPAAVAAVVRKLMAKKPADRYQTPAELAESLAKMASWERQPPDSSSYQGADAPRSPGATADGSTVDTPATLRRGRRQADRRRWLKLNLLGGGVLLVCVGLFAALLSSDRPGPPRPTEHQAAIPTPPLSNPPPAGPALPPLAETAWVSDPAPLPGVESWTLTSRTGQGFVKALAFDPRGRWLATASEDHVIRLVDATNGQLTHALVGHDDAVRQLAWSHDGRYLASTTANRTFIWDGSTGWRSVPLRIGATASWSPSGPFLMLRHNDGIVAVLAPDGKYIKTYGQQADWKNLAWAADGRSLQPGGPNKVVRGWSPDGQTFAAIQTGGKILLSGARSTSFQAHPNKVGAVAWSPDGHLLATSGDESTVKLWNAETLQLVRTIPAGRHGVYALAWSADSRLLATGNNDNRVRVWDAAGGDKRIELSGNGDMSWGRAWSPDGRFLVSGSFHLWDVTTGAPGRSWSSLGGTTGTLAWSPDGRFLAADAWGHTVRLWDVAAGKVHGELKDARVTPPTYPLLAWAPRQSVLAVSSSNPAMVYLWNGDRAELLRPVGPLTARLKSMAWSPDGQLLATAAEDKSLHLWRADTGERLRSLEGPQAAVRCLAWSDNGRLLAGGENASVWLWHADTGRVVQTFGPTGFRSLDGHIITAVAWSPGSRELTALGNEGRLWTWDTDTGLLRSQRATTARRGDFSPDGRLLAAGGPMYSLRLWDAETGRVRLTWHNLDKGPITISPDGHYRCAPEVEAELFYVVQTTAGQETLAPADFTARFGWKNDPDRARPSNP